MHLQRELLKCLHSGLARFSGLQEDAASKWYTVVIPVGETGIFFNGLNKGCTTFTTK